MGDPPPTPLSCEYKGEGGTGSCCWESGRNRQRVGAGATAAACLHAASVLPAPLWLSALGPCPPSVSFPLLWCQQPCCKLAPTVWSQPGLVVVVSTLSCCYGAKLGWCSALHTHNVLAVEQGEGRRRGEQRLTGEEVARRGSWGVGRYLGPNAAREGIGFGGRAGTRRELEVWGIGGRSKLLAPPPCHCLPRAPTTAFPGPVVVGVSLRQSSNQSDAIRETLFSHAETEHSTI